MTERLHRRECEIAGEMTAMIRLIVLGTATENDKDNLRALQRERVERMTPLKLRYGQY